MDSVHRWLTVADETFLTAPLTLRPPTSHRDVLSSLRHPDGMGALSRQLPPRIECRHPRMGERAAEYPPIVAYVQPILVEPVGVHAP